MMDDNNAILELITEFLVSKNLLHTAQTLQQEWGGLYPGHSFPDINNLMDNFPTAIPVEPSPPGPFMYSFHQQHQLHQHHQPNHVNTTTHGNMDDGDDTGNNTDETMNEDDEGGDAEVEDGEVEEDGEGGEHAATKDGEADDTASVDSAYSRILVEDISEIMDEIAIDEDDMAEGEIDPLANEASPSEESESEMDEGDNEEAGEDEYEEEGEEGDEGDNREPGEDDEDEDEEGEADDQEERDQDEEDEEDEGEGEGEEDKLPRKHRQIHSPSPTRGVIESVTELLGQHIQSQRDEFYQEDESTNNDSVAEKDLEDIAALSINDTNTNINTSLNANITATDKSDGQQDKPLGITPLDTDLSTPELRGYECDVTIVNYENKKSGAMFSPLISPVPHSPTPVISPGIIPSMRSPSATLLPHSRSALYKRDPSSPLGKKHVQITSDSAPVSRSNSNLSQRHTTPPPPSPMSGRSRISVSTPSTPIPSVTSPLAATAPTTPNFSTTPAPLPQSPTAANIPTTPTALNTHLPTSPSTPTASHSPVIPPTPTTPPPSYSTVVAETGGPIPNGLTKSSSGSSDKGKGEKSAGGRRLSLDAKNGDVVMRDISYDERPPFSYPVLADGTTYDCFNLKIVHVKNRTGFESTKDFPIKANTLVAGRYQILEFLDSAAFSKAVRALDLHTGNEVCMKIIKNNKDYVDQSLDEIKLLKYLNSTGDPHKYHILQLYDFFYYKEHLFIVTELLRENLYEFYKYTNENGHPPYFTIPRLQKVAQQCLSALEFIHGLDIIHTDLKPENILIKSYSRCEIKIIDFGSSCFTRDHLGSYVQSRDYRAIEVILGLPYSAKIDIWSLGCILAELFTGKVLFVNRSLVTLLARVSALVGPIPQDMIAKGRFSHKFFTKYHSLLYERDEKSGQYFFLQPKRIPLKEWMKSDDDDFVDFIQTLLSLRPDDRPTATAALQHRWLRKVYPPF